MSEESERNKSKASSSSQASYQQNTISFVSFDAKSSDASRKAVRKQAALSSAAARKATIAKKVAQQQKDAEAERQAAESAVKSQTVREGAKRKRSIDEAGGPWQAGVSIIPSSPLSRVSDERAYRRQIQTPRRDLLAAPANVISHATRTPERAYDQSATYTRYFGLPSPAYDERRMIKANHKESEMQRGVTQFLTTSTTVPAAYTRHAINHAGWSILNVEFEPDEEHSRIPLSPESMASPQSHSASRMDPFNQYPVPYHPIYDRLLHYMLTVFAPRGWSSLKITHEEGEQYENFMTRQALAEPALFLVRVLFASGDLIKHEVIEPNVAVALRSKAIKAINDALNDSDRSTSDGLILAVGRIALTECLYGDKNAAHTIHRPAQRRMITLRGGMNTLGFPPLIKRLMRWSDRVMSIQGNTQRFLPDEEDRGNTTLTIDQSLNLIEDWAPEEGRSIRRIAISDLIT